MFTSSLRAPGLQVLSGTLITFKNNFSINLLFKIHLKESCVLDFYQHFYFCKRDITKIVTQFWLLQV